MSFFFFGFLGGVIRSLLGLIKYSQSYKEVKIKPWYLLSTTLLSGFVGLITAWVISDLGIALLDLENLPLAFALVVGYAGGDFIENIFKIMTKDPNFLKIGEKFKK